MSNGHRPVGGSVLKTESERIHMIAAFREVGTFRGAGAMCGCDPKTIKRALAHLDDQAHSARRRERTRNYDMVTELVAKRVESTAGRISAQRLLSEARAAGYSGSGRNFRRLVAKVKLNWRRDQHRCLPPNGLVAR